MNPGRAGYRKRAHRAFAAAASIVCLCAAGDASAFRFGGPLQARNGFPLAAILDAPYLERASYEDSLSIGVSHSSIDFIESDNGLDFRLDLEATEIAMRYKRTVAGFCELGLDVPFTSFNGGFLDGAIGWFHRATGVRSGKITESPGRFLFDVRNNGAEALRGESGRLRPGDIRVHAKKIILEGKAMVLAAGADLEFPTGDADKGYGNGRLDKRISIMAEGSIGDRVNVVANAGKVFPGDFHGLATVRFDDYLYGGLSVEAAISGKSSLVGQAMVQQMPLPPEGIVFPSLRKKPVLFSIGYRYEQGANRLELSITENLNPSFAPDIMLNVTLTRDLR